MKFTMATQELNYIISKCANVISPKQTIPILSNILLEAYNGILTLTATDLTVSIRCSTDVNVIEEGATTLPAKKLGALVRELTSTNVEVKTGKNEITEILADSSRFRLHGMDKAEFPALPDLEGSVKFTIGQGELKDVLFRTSFAVSREDNRYVLTGVYMHVSNARATFAGTDGKRLARTYLPINVDSSYSGSFIIPLKATEEILKNLKDEGEAIVYLLDDKIAVETNGTTIITKLLNGEYPDIKQIIPSATQHNLTLHREELMTLLRQVSLFANEKEQQHVARFTFTNGELYLSANAMQVGEGKVSMPVNYQGEKLEIAFNPTFFLDVLRHSKGETVTMGISDPFNPGLIADQEVPSFVGQDISPLFVLMPMRLNEE